MWWHLKVRGERVSVLTIEEQSLLVIRVVQTAGFLCFFFLTWLMSTKSWVYG